MDDQKEKLIFDSIAVWQSLFHNLFRLLIDKGVVSTAEVASMLNDMAPELTESLESPNAGGMVKDLSRLLSAESAMNAALKEPKH